MEDTRASPPKTTTAKRKQEMSAMSRLKKDCLSFTVSLQEGFSYVKAFFIGQAKKLTARNEKEATEAYLQAAKMQVDAADDAENAKKRLDTSM